MAKFIKKVQIRLFDLIFVQSLELKEGLNIISGENGTGKTALLSFVSDNVNNPNVVEKEPNDSLNLISFSPKRSAEKQQAQQAYRIINQDPNISQNTLNQLKQKINDNQYQQIRSVAEILNLACEKKTNAGNIDKITAASIIKIEFDAILKSVFLDYELDLVWDSKEKYYSIKIKKYGKEIELTNLSSGENAIVALLFNIYYVKDDSDVYLIDEPEVHLNWILEEKLFSFLGAFSKEHGKQIIVVTHSRICFRSEYKDAVKFFSWEREKIVLSNTASDKLKELLCGEITQLIESFDAGTPIVYVEDEAQKIVVDNLATRKSVKVYSVIAANSGNIESLAKKNKDISGINVFYLRDGDNKSLKKSDYHQNLIHLQKYCIENYLLDKLILDEIKVSKELVGDFIFDVIKEESKPPMKEILQNYTHSDREWLGSLDASYFIEPLYIKLGFQKKEEFIKAYIAEAFNQEREDEVFSELLKIFADKS